MPTQPTTTPVLAINDLRTWFHTADGLAKAVDGVSYHVNSGETLGVVGESGCGKSVTALSILRLIPTPPGEIVSGEIRLNGQDILALPLNSMRRIRGNRVSMIFQEPMTSLNPVFTIGYQLAKIFTLHRGATRKEARQQSLAILEACEIPSPARILKAYPHQLSGGMRQRVMIAMAIGCNPDVLLADEPTTALDVTIQAQILDLLLKLQQRMGMALVLITHDLGVVANFARRVVVMYAGKKVEEAPVDTLFRSPGHPYTRALLQSVPVLGRNEKFLKEIKGMVPPPFQEIKGCRYARRCSEAEDACRRVDPPLKTIAPGHLVACLKR